LRSSYQNQYAVRADEDARAAERLDASSHASSVDPPADLSNQRDPRLAEFGITAPVGRKGVEELSFSGRCAEKKCTRRPQ
jgi:hypothetical protein